MSQAHPESPYWILSALAKPSQRDAAARALLAWLTTTARSVRIFRDLPEGAGEEVTQEVAMRLVTDASAIRDRIHVANPVLEALRPMEAAMRLDATSEVVTAANSIVAAYIRKMLYHRAVNWLRDEGSDGDGKGHDEDPPQPPPPRTPPPTEHGMALLDRVAKRMAAAGSVALAYGTFEDLVGLGTGALEMADLVERRIGEEGVRSGDAGATSATRARAALYKAHERYRKALDAEIEAMTRDGSLSPDEAFIARFGIVALLNRSVKKRGRGQTRLPSPVKES